MSPLSRFTSRIEAVCVGAARTISAEESPARQKTYKTAILKLPQPGSVPVGPLGLAGDVQVDTKSHGGPDQAVHAHFRHTARLWSKVLGWTPAPGYLGENLALADGTEADVCVGDVFRAGTALLQVTCPRIPCATLADQLQFVDAVTWAIGQGCTGFYFRVLEAGEITAGDNLELVDRPSPFASIARVNEMYYAKERDAADVRALLTAQALPAKWRARFAPELGA